MTTTGGNDVGRSRNGFRGPGAHRAAAVQVPGERSPRVVGLSRAQLQHLLDGLEPPAGRPRAKATKPGRQPGEMNKTEAKYAALLEARVRDGEVVAWWYESLTLKLAPNTHYRPDFLVMLADGSLEIHEVKGGFVQEDAWIKSKITAASFPFRLIVAQWRDRRWHTIEL